MPLVSEWESDKSYRKRWIILCLMAVGLFFISRPILVSATHQLRHVVATIPVMKQSEQVQQRHEILVALSQSGVDLDDAMTIARTVIEESRRYDIPVSLMLAIMKKESNFDVDARSSVNARGIMQIHPLTWDAYAKKLNLNVSRKHAFDPALNIKVAAAVLWDLRDQYEKKGYKDKVLWDYVLSAYYAGAESVKGGLRKNHRYYVKKVRQYADELSQGSQNI
jgi:soluble lytic murein transglycosylase-like protein